MQSLTWRRPAAILFLLCLLGTIVHADGPARAPINLLVNEGFARGEAGWTVPDSDTAYSVLVPAQAGPYLRALRVTSLSESQATTRGTSRCARASRRRCTRATR